ncbi:hypothetical protein L1987_73277 [Smallanthus sonchifolius]|uniref:Uncharacterized protein n=1 Tax=Smallanthus sonchifolius TaxID=185202 RepID=A0ACB8ZZC7_9ASTR|nr:hypothetical protein L1987_73277 [Smallanthus sonchifolius]
MIRVAIGGKSKDLLGHLTTDPPMKTDDKYEQWEQNDLIVFSWLIQNIEPALASNLTEFPTTKSLWDALVVTYSSGKDKLQTFDLHVKANEFKQNGVSLEDFWIVMQGIWGEIDRRDPNPMTCANDITTYNKIRAEQKLFQFLNALDRKYDHIKREILRWDPLPTAEAAYAAVRKETAHQNILGGAPEETSTQQGVAVGLAATESKEAEGLGFLSKGHRRPEPGKKTGPPPRQDRSHLKCSHCGMMKHTKEECFKIVGFPEWWNEGRNRTSKQGSLESKAAAAIGGNPSDNTQEAATTKGLGFGGIETGGDGRAGNGGEECPSNPSICNPNFSCPQVYKLLKKGPHTLGKGYLATQKHLEQNSPWIFDSGATDTMTCEPSDFTSKKQPHRSHIQTANGDVVHVRGGGTVEISPTLKLSNCLFVPSLSHKLLSISHVTKELNCTVLMYPTFCILQDIRTRTIIGRGTERQGLYYVDEVTRSSNAMLAHGTKDREAWLWHRRLGHPSAGYLHLLFPEFFPSNTVLNCGTCILAKSHRQSFKPSNTKVSEPFSLVHSDVWGPA